VKSTVAKSAAKNLRGRYRNYRLHSFLLCYIGAKDADHRAVFYRIYMKTDDKTSMKKGIADLKIPTPCSRTPCYEPIQLVHQALLASPPQTTWPF
jgi:hypothetical protein